MKNRPFIIILSNAKWTVYLHIFYNLYKLFILKIFHRTPMAFIQILESGNYQQQTDVTHCIKNCGKNNRCGKKIGRTVHMWLHMLCFRLLDFYSQMTASSFGRKANLEILHELPRETSCPVICFGYQYEVFFKSSTDNGCRSHCYFVQSCIGRSLTISAFCYLVLLKC